MTILATIFLRSFPWLDGIPGFYLSGLVVYGHKPSHNLYSLTRLHNRNSKVTPKFVDPFGLKKSGQKKSLSLLNINMSTIYSTMDYMVITIKVRKLH